MFGLTPPIIYIRISPELLTVRDPKSGNHFAEVPEVAIARSPKERIVAFGSAARTTTEAVDVIANPFAHPRTLVSDFTVAEQLLKAVLRNVLPRSILSPSPRIILHPLGDPAGGLTQIEIRALREMALGIGAVEANVWQGRDLTDDELLSGRLPVEGKLLS